MQQKKARFIPHMGYGTKNFMIFKNSWNRLKKIEKSFRPIIFRPKLVHGGAPE